MAATTDSKTTAQSAQPAAPAAPTRPVKLARPGTTLTDKYALDQGTIFLSGIQALVRVLLDQHRADVAAGLDTATFVSGYQGSPLGGFDKEIMSLGPLAAEHAIAFTPGLNEELAATAVYGSQLAGNLPGARHDGVLGVWYGKNPGLDRAADALRHANFAGTDPSGGALALVGDDPSCKSSTVPSGGEATLAALNMPTFYPGNLQEVLDLGRHAIACSRASGLWSALKIVTNVADAAGTAQVWTSDGWAERFALPFDPADTGYGHDGDEVAAVRVESGELLTGYYDAVHQRTIDYVGALTDDDLPRIVDRSWDPPVTLGVRLVSVISDDLQHAGQAAFVRGLL